MRKPLFALAAAAIGFGALGALPAQAQGFSIAIGTPGYYGPPAPVYRPYPVARPYRAYRPAHYRPAYRPYPAYAPAYYGPRCSTEVTRYWDGWEWVSRRRRICD